MFPLDVLGEPAWQRLTWTLLHFLWQGLAVAVVAAVFLYVWPVCRAHNRYLIYLSAMVAMVACPLVTFMVIDVPTSTAERELELVASEIRIGPIGPEARESQPSNEHSVVAASEMGESASLSVAATWGGQLPRYVDAMQPYTLVVWIIGVLLLAMQLSLSWLHVRWLAWGCRVIPADLAAKAATLSERLGLSSPPRVCVSEKIREAIVVGLWRPLVLLPASWLTEMTPEVLEAVIAHELAHVRRLDLWVNLLQRLMEMLLFYHPAVWWLSRHVRLEREMCADELAVGATSERLLYATALEQLGRMRLSQTTPQLGASIGGNKMVLLNRVGNVLGLSASNKRARWWPVGLLALAVPLTIWLASTGIISPTQDEARAEEAADNTSAWSDPVDGLRTRLRPTQRQWKAGATPTLALDLWNDSDQDNMFSYEGGQEVECEIEVDGQWYRWAASTSIIEARGHSLKAGQSKDEAVKISLTGAWARDALRLNLTPGTHRLRVAFTPLRPNHRGRRPRVVSKPVEIEVVAAEPQARSETAGRWSDIETVMASLRSELVKIGSAYPELPDADAIRITRTDVFYGLKYIRNCTYLGKRGHEDTGPHPVHLRFEVYSLSEQGDPIAYAVRKPDHTWVNLRLVGWTRVYVGKDASPGFADKARQIIDRHVAMVESLDRRAKDTPQPVAKDWGWAVEGVQFRLHADESSWQQGIPPKLLADFRNRGERDLRIDLEHESWQLEIDGKWHRPSTGNTGERRWLPLEPGQHQMNVPIWIGIDDNLGRKLRELKPGKHTLRAARHFWQGPPEERLRVVSNPVEIEIVAYEPANKAEKTAPAHAVQDMRTIRVPKWPRIKLKPGVYAGFGTFESQSWGERIGTFLSGPWRPVEVENGVIELPQATALKLSVDSNNNTDLGALDALGPNDLQVLALPSVNRISSEAMIHIGRLTGLKALFLGGADIRDEDLKHLAGLKELRALDLQECPLTDVAVGPIASMKSLRHLRLWETAITRDGYRQLHEALPQCKIDWEERLRKPR